MLKNIKLLFLTAIFVTICYKEVFTTTSYRDRVIGCLFSDVCSPNEACFDDNAFGRCEDYDPVSKKYSSHYVYDLDRKTLQLLEKELDRLSEEGFTWNDSYAQCVLKTVLNDRPRIVYDPTSCNYRRFPEPIVDLLVSDKTHREQPDSDLPSQAKPRQDDNIFPTFSPSPQQSPSGPSDSLPIVPSLFGKGAKQNQLAQSSSTRSKLTNELLSESLPSSSPSSPLNSYQTIKAQTQINSNDKEFSDVNRKPIGGSKQTQLSDNVIKSKLRSEYLKRSSPGRLNTNSDSQFPDELNDQDLSEAVQNQLLQVLLGNLKNSDSISQFGSDNNNEYSEPVQPLPDNYLAYSADNIPYLSNPQPDRKYDQQSEDELLQSYGPQYQPVWFRKTPIASPLVPKAYSSDANQLEDDDHNNIYIVKGPLPDIFNRPEIRVLRDANQDQNEDILVKPIGDNELTSDEDVAQLLPMLQSPSDPDVIMGDVIENDGNTNEPNDDDYAKLIDNILGQSQNKANKDDSSMEDELIGSVVNLNGFNQNDDDVDEDDDEDEKINKEMKEMLFGDINYNNNYDTKMPNFYRKHRYDIKKPGPKYYEEYFFKPDNEESSEVEKSNDEPLLIENKVMESLEDSPIMKKKDNNIRSSKPVAEGPVKVDAKSENTIIIRPAEEGEETSLEAIDSTHTYVVTDKMLGEEDSQKFVQTLEQVFKLPRGTFSNLRKEEFQITFKVNPNYRDLNASQVASRIEDLANVIKDITGYNVKETGIGDKTKLPVVSATIIKKSNEKLINITLLICSVILAIISAAFIIFLFRRNGKFREKVKGFVKISEDWMNFDYQDLCRQRMQGKSKEKEESPKKGNLTGSNESVNKLTNGENLASQQGSEAPQNSSNRSSTSSWVEEPVLSNMDISTGHIILSYMEDHLKKKDRLDQEWEALCAYEADPCATNAASQKQNANKNRYPDILPYDHSRVILNDLANSSNSDYINANTITDHDPRNPAYIVTQGPLSNTKADFWQMIWEQGSVIIVMLTRLRENGLSMCDRYWPEEGTETYQNYEVNLVSEHIWCEDYLVRSFYLKNLKTSETRTVTQFHFLSWPENGIPPNTKSILDFRRKVNKSYKGRSCPIVVHCSDGIGRTGTYILIDMVLNRLAKGAKEIDIAATLEHIRDQRPGIVKNKAQFEFVLLAVAEEVQAILKALSQNN